MLGNRWPHKPPLGSRLDPEHPLAQKLRGFYAINEGSGLILNDATGNLPLIGSGTTWGTGRSGRALAASGENVGAYAALPAGLQCPWPITMVAAVRWNSTANGFLAGVQAGYVTPVSWMVSSNGSDLYMYWTEAGASSNVKVLPSFITIGTDYVLGFEWNGVSLKAYVNGVLSYSGVQTFAASASYSASSTLFIGSNAAGAGAGNRQFYGMGWWNRVLQPSEHAALAVNPWQVFQPRRTYFGLMAALPVVYSLSGPSIGFPGTASSAFTLTPSLTTTDTITFSDGGHGGTFTPSSLTFTASSAPQTFTYTPVVTGSLSLTLTNGNGDVINGSPVVFTVPVSYTLTDPSPDSTVAQVASGNFTLTPAGITTDTITFSDGGHGGTFTPSSLTFTASSAPQTFTYTPATAGTKTLTLTSADGGIITGSPTTISVTAIGYTLTDPSPDSTVAQVASGNFTLTPASAVTDTITFSDGDGGTFTPSSLTFTASATPQTFTYTPATAGTKTLTMTSADAGTITGSPTTISVTAIDYTLAGPDSGAYLAASSAFTLNPAATVTDTVTFSDGGAGGTFTPSSLTFTASATPQTFTYTPASVGTKTLTLTSADGGTITGSPATYYLIPTPGSIRFTNQCEFVTASNNLLSNSTAATVAFRIQFNTLGGSGLLNLGLIGKVTESALVGFTTGATPVGTYNLLIKGNSGTSVGVTLDFQIGIPNHIVMSWSNGAQAIYVNGTLVATGTYAQSTLSGYTGVLSIGPQGVAPVDLQISDVAIWNGYAANQTDVINLYFGTSNPLTLATPASAWYPLGGTNGTQPNVASDPGFLDWTGNGYTINAVDWGSAANAVYDGALGFTPPIEVSAYVSKSGKLAVFHPVATVPAATGAYIPQSVTSIPSNPAITWNGNPIQADGPTWDSVSNVPTFAAYRLQCGSIESVGIASGGSGYDGSTTVTATGGGATAQATFGAPVLGTGVTQYALTGVGSYSQYTSLPVAAVSGGTFTTAPAATVILTGTTVTVVPAAGGILGCGSGVTAAPTMTLSGGVGTGATATAALSGSGIGSITITAAGSGYSATTTTAHVVDTHGGTGSGAALTVTVSRGVVESIAVNSAGSGYTNPVVVIQPGTGSGAAATPTVLGGGAIHSPLTVNSAGSGYGLGTTARIVDPTGTGATLIVTVSAEGVASIAASVAGSGYTNPTVIIQDGAQATVTPTIGSYIQSVPVTSGGSGYTSVPTLTVSAGAGTGASLVPVMSGASAGDVLSYTAAWGWIQCALGGAVASPPPGSSTPAGIANFTGTIEGAVGLLPGFPASPTMPLGVNIGTGETAYSATDSCFRNYMKRIDMNDYGWTISSGTLTVLVDGTPVSWTAPSATLTCVPYNPYYAYNPVDSRLGPCLTGTWTIIYDDPNVGTGNAANVTMACISGHATVGGPTVTISGTTVTQSYLVDYISNPANWNIPLEVQITQAQGLWQLENFALIPPQPAGYPVSRTPALAMDGNVASWLTTPRSQVPACLRTMDVCANYGISNFVDPTDLQDPDSFSWGCPKVPSAPPATTTDPMGNTILSGTITFEYMRPYITDPSKGSIASGGDGTYDWEITGRLYSSQWGLTGTDSFGPYLQLPPGDNGTFAVGTGSPQDYVAMELVSSARHNVKTGQIIGTNGGSGSYYIPVYGTTAQADVADWTYVAFVTGEYTIVIVTPTKNVPGSSIAMLGETSTTPLTTQVPVGFTATLQVPYGASAPFEFVAAMASQLGTDLWVCVPGFASPACSAAIAERVAANLTPGLKVYVEYMNEHWNPTTNNSTVIFLASLMGYLPTGTQIGSRYTTTNGVALSSDQFYALQAAVHHDIWAGVFSALGRGSDVVRVFGIQFGAVAVTATVASAASQFGLPMDAVAGAPYYDYAFSGSMPSISAAFTPAGGAMPAGLSGSPGNWPVDAIIDFVKHYYYYNPPYWTAYALAVPLLNAWGQPVNAIRLAAGGTGGSLAVGTYYAYYTYVNASGQETTVGNSQNSVAVTTGQVVTVTLPPIPTWLTGGSVNIYLTPVNSLPGTEMLYANVPNADLSSTTSTTYTCTVANTGTVSPPVSSQISLSHGLPQQVAYEFSPQALVPGSVPFAVQIARDMFYHPAFHDLMTTLFGALQAGNPGVAGSGLSLANYFSLTDPWSVNGQMWAMAVSTAQQAGYGESNQFATAQGGSPADNRAHDLGNQAVAVQAARDWWDSFAPPSPVVTATSPASGATAVPVANSVVATFSEAIQSGSLDFTIAPTAGGSKVGGTVLLDDTETIATFVPGRPFNYATGYTASIEATGANRATMASAYTWSWTTQDLPPSGSWFLQPINYAFSSAIVATNLTITATINGVSFPGTTSYNSSTYVATFTPFAPWTASKYILTISGATAPDGTPMATESIAFTPGTATPGKGWFGGLGRPTMKV